MKKNMRKVAALGLCVALGATMLTACGGSKGESASGGKTELNFGIWDENQRPVMEKMVKAYEKENSDVKINIQLTPYKGGEYWTKLEAAASGGKAPDVFWLNVLHLDSYVEGGILDDLTDKITCDDSKADLSLAGEYEIIYTVTDENGFTAKQTAKVTVADGKTAKKDGKSSSTKTETTKTETIKTETGSTNSSNSGSSNSGTSGSSNSESNNTGSSESGSTTPSGDSGSTDTGSSTPSADTGSNNGGNSSSDGTMSVPDDFIPLDPSFGDNSGTGGNGGGNSTITFN